MNALILYILQVNIFLIGFYIVYRMLFRNETFFNVNRIYLLFAGIASVTLPLIKFREFVDYGFVVQLPEFTVAGSAAAGEGEVYASWFIFAVVAYSAGALVVLAKLGHTLYTVFRMRSKFTTEKVDGFTLVKLEGETPTFSFFNQLFLNQKDLHDQQDSIVQHELVHIRQRHSIDLLFFELLRIPFWYNPVLSMYKTTLSEVHEFLADASVVRNGDKAQYSLLLLSQTFGVQPAGIIHNFFNQSLLKRRIMMMNKVQSKPIAKLKYLMLLPAMFGMIWMASCAKESTEKIASGGSAVEDNTVVATSDGPVDKNKIYKEVDVMPEFPGGQQALFSFMGEHIKFTDEAKTAGAEGRVVIEFVVASDGTIKDSKVLRGLGHGLDEQALQVINSMPQWTPGQHKGEAVNVKLVLPIMYKLEE